MEIEMPMDWGDYEAVDYSIPPMNNSEFNNNNNNNNMETRFQDSKYLLPFVS